MNQRTDEIERLLEQGVSARKIARELLVSQEWVAFVRNRYLARKYKKLYQDLVEHLNGQEERV